MVPEISGATYKFFCYLGPFFPFHPRDNPENQNVENFKKIPGESFNNCVP